MNMFEQLKAWADNFGVKYYIRESGNVIFIDFESHTYSNASFSYNKENGGYCWYGGD